MLLDTTFDYLCRCGQTWYIQVTGVCQLEVLENWLLRMCLFAEKECVGGWRMFVRWLMVGVVLWEEISVRRFAF